MILPGIYTDLSSEEYHKDKTSISRSSIMDFKKSPRKYWAKHINPNRPKEEPKAAWNFGSAFHMFILEPDLFNNTYLIEPERVFLKDVGREKYEEFKLKMEQIEKSGSPVISSKEWETILAMRESLKENKKAWDLIEGGVYESSYFWVDSESGLTLKSRPDILHDKIYVDLKTCTEGSPDTFQREMVKYGNYIQAAMVRDSVEILKGSKISACINICVETTYPYSVGIYIIDPEAVQFGSDEYKRISLDLKHAFVHNTWDDYPISTIGLPKWVL